MEEAPPYGRGTWLMPFNLMGWPDIAGQQHPLESLGAVMCERRGSRLVDHYRHKK
jgi:hypothetical protein